MAMVKQQVPATWDKHRRSEYQAVTRYGAWPDLSDALRFVPGTPLALAVEPWVEQWGREVLPFDFGLRSLELIPPHLHADFFTVLGLPRLPGWYR